MLCVAILRFSASKNNAESSVFFCDTEMQSPHLVCVLPVNSILL